MHPTTGSSDFIMVGGVYTLEFLEKYPRSSVYSNSRTTELNEFVFSTYMCEPLGKAVEDSKEQKVGGCAFKKRRM